MANPETGQCALSQRLTALENEFKARIGSLEAEVRHLRTLVVAPSHSVAVDKTMPVRVDVKNTFLHIEEDQPTLGGSRSISGPMDFGGVGTGGLRISSAPVATGVPAASKKKRQNKAPVVPEKEGAKSVPLKARGNGDKTRAPGFDRCTDRPLVTKQFTPSFRTIRSGELSDPPAGLCSPAGLGSPVVVSSPMAPGSPRDDRLKAATPPPGLSAPMSLDTGKAESQYLQALGPLQAAPLSGSQDAAASAGYPSMDSPAYVGKHKAEQLKAALLSAQPYATGWTIKNTFIEGHPDSEEEPQPTLGGRSVTMPIPQTDYSSSDIPRPPGGLEQQKSNEAELPEGFGMASVGSENHPDGCQPCAWIWRTRTGGCMNGANCSFCHLCDSTELKKRRKAKIQRLRNERATERAKGKTGEEGSDDEDEDDTQPQIQHINTAQFDDAESLKRFQMLQGSLYSGPGL